MCFKLVGAFRPAQGYLQAVGNLAWGARGFYRFYSFYLGSSRLPGPGGGRLYEGFKLIVSFRPPRVGAILRW